MSLQFLAAYYRLAEGCEHILYEWSPPGVEPFPFAVRGVNLRTRVAFYVDFAGAFARYPAQMTLAKRAAKIRDRFCLASEEARTGRPSLAARYEVWAPGDPPEGLTEAFEEAAREPGFDVVLVKPSMVAERINRMYDLVEAGFSDEENQFIQAMAILRLARDHL